MSTYNSFVNNKRIPVYPLSLRPDRNVNFPNSEMDDSNKRTPVYPLSLSPDRNMNFSNSEMDDSKNETVLERVKWVS